MAGCVLLTETTGALTFTKIPFYCPSFLSLRFHFRMQTSFYQLCMSLYIATNISEKFSLILYNYIIVKVGKDL